MNDTIVEELKIYRSALQARCVLPSVVEAAEAATKECRVSLTTYDRVVWLSRVMGELLLIDGTYARNNDNDCTNQSECIACILMHKWLDRPATNCLHIKAELRPKVVELVSGWHRFTSTCTTCDCSHKSVTEALEGVALANAQAAIKRDQEDLHIFGHAWTESMTG